MGAGRQRVRLIAPSPLIPALAVGLRLLGVLPFSLGRLLVRTNAAFVPFGLGWAALGWRLLVTGDA